MMEFLIVNFCCSEVTLRDHDRYAIDVIAAVANQGLRHAYGKVRRDQWIEE
jgi:hypothetical protein